MELETKMTDRPTDVRTVFYATDAETQASLQPSDMVEVTEERPELFEVLFELHPISADLEPVSDGVFRVKWEAAMNHPHRTSTGAAR